MLIVSDEWQLKLNTMQPFLVIKAVEKLACRLQVSACIVKLNFPKLYKTLLHKHFLPRTLEYVKNILACFVHKLNNVADIYI